MILNSSEEIDVFDRINEEVFCGGILRPEISDGDEHDAITHQDH